MFHHPSQLHAPVGQATEETSTSTSRLPGLSEPVTDSESMGRPLPPRIA